MADRTWKELLEWSDRKLDEIILKDVGLAFAFLEALKKAVDRGLMTGELTPRKMTSKS